MVQYKTAESIKFTCMITVAEYPHDSDQRDTRHARTLSKSSHAYKRD